MKARRALECKADIKDGETIRTPLFFSLSPNCFHTLSSKHGLNLPLPGALPPRVSPLRMRPQHTLKALLGAISHLRAKRFIHPPKTSPFKIQHTSKMPMSRTLPLVGVPNFGGKDPSIDAALGNSSPPVSRCKGAE